MKIEELKSDDKLTSKFKITVPANDIQARIEQRLQSLAKDVKIDGFRPGKVPMQVLQKRFGDRVRGEVLQDAVNDTSSKVLIDKKIKPAQQPHIEVKDFKDDTLTYEMSVLRIPDFDIAPFNKLKIEKPVTEASEKDVTDALERIAESNKATESITAKRAIKKGDFVVIDFDGSVDGEKKPGMKADDYELEIGSNTFIDNFEDQLTGKKIGDEADIKVKFPENYHAGELANKDAVFAIKVKDIKKAVTPKVDDALAEKLGIGTLEELKTNIKERIQQEYDSVSQARVKRNVLDALDEANKFETPHQMVDQEYQSIWTSHLEDIEKRGLDKAKAEKDKETQKEFKEIAERRVRLGILLAEVGDRENVEITPEELNNAVQREAARYPGQEQEFFDYLRSNRQALQAVQAPLYEDKVIELILSQADIKEKKVDSDTLTADPDEAKEEKRIKKASKAKKKA